MANDFDILISRQKEKSCKEKRVGISKRRLYAAGFIVFIQQKFRVKPAGNANGNQGVPKSRLFIPQGNGHIFSIGI